MRWYYTVFSRNLKIYNIFLTQQVIYNSLQTGFGYEYGEHGEHGTDGDYIWYGVGRP